VQIKFTALTAWRLVQMTRPYSMDLRERAMDRLAAGETSYEVSAALKVAVSSVIKWAQRKRATGSAAPGKMGGYRPLIIAGEHRDWVLAEVECTPHVTIALLTDGLAARGLKVHPASVGRFLHREGKSFKKNRASRRTGDTPRTGPSPRAMETLSGQN
jgi:putative transposase